MIKKLSIVFPPRDVHFHICSFSECIDLLPASSSTSFLPLYSSLSVIKVVGQTFAFFPYSHALPPFSVPFSILLSSSHWFCSLEAVIPTPRRKLQILCLNSVGTSHARRRMLDKNTTYRNYLFVNPALLVHSGVSDVLPPISCRKGNLSWIALCPTHTRRRERERGLILHFAQIFFSFSLALFPSLPLFQNISIPSALPGPVLPIRPFLSPYFLYLSSIFQEQKNSPIGKDMLQESSRMSLRE